MTVLAPASAEALRECREITRRCARNFYYGLRLLPEPQRSALYAIYAWMRRADDLADGSHGDTKAALERIERFRSATAKAIAGSAPGDDPVLLALRETARRFPVAPAHLDAMLDGQRLDLEERSYATFAELRDYCYRVASTVGLVCIDVWGYHDERAPMLAVDRGIAFQLTNILRDLVEDLASGRLYLPQEDLDRHSLDAETLRRTGSGGGGDRERESDRARCEHFLLEQIERAERYYVSSAPLEEMITPSCRPTLWAMTAIYHGLLAKMRDDPIRLLVGPRIRLSTLRKGAIAIAAKWRARTIAVGRNGHTAEA